MTQGLDGIERRLITINPETLEAETYVCQGYRNISRNEGNEEPKFPTMTDWYMPLSKKGEYHSMEFLKLCAKIYKRPFNVIYKGQF
jgi:hypothetical protein